ncbi:MAG: CBS domain-containing protein [Candidatus Nezhaarchaeales archaeon]
MQRLLVKDLMSKDVIYAEVPGGRDEVLSIMRSKKVTGLPVVKKGTRKVVGVVTRRDLMKKPDEEQVALIMSRDHPTVEPSDTISKVIKLITERKVRLLPVTVNGELIGVITVSDLVYKALANSNLTTPVKEYMDRRIPTIWEKTPLPVAYSIMNWAGTQVLVVLDDNSKMVGIVTEHDFLNLGEVVYKQRTSSTKPSSEEEWDWSVSTIIYIGKGQLSLPPKPVSEIMSKQLITVPDFLPLNECAKKLQRYDVNQAPVVNAKGELMGVIYDVQMIKALLETS